MLARVQRAPVDAARALARAGEPRFGARRMNYGKANLPREYRLTDSDPWPDFPAA